MRIRLENLDQGCQDLPFKYIFVLVASSVDCDIYIYIRDLCDDPDSEGGVVGVDWGMNGRLFVSKNVRFRVEFLKTLIFVPSDFIKWPL